MILYDYFRSTAAYRVRIALNLKALAYQQRSVNLLKGEQQTEHYQTFNPQGLVPALVLDDGRVLTQSLAICEYLDDLYPSPALLPTDPADRARVRALALAIACDIHPLNNLRVLSYLTGPLSLSESLKLTWYRHWISTGLTALETSLNTSESGHFCHGDTPGLADICLLPQLFNARRFDCDLTPYPALMRIAERCETLAAFAQAHPVRQPDAR